MITEEQRVKILESFDSTKQVEIDMGAQGKAWLTERALRSMQMVVLEAGMPVLTTKVADKLISDFIAKSFYAESK